MKIRTFQSHAKTADANLQGVLAAVGAEDQPPDFAALHASFDVDRARARSGLAQLNVGTVHGGTSCRGTMTQSGHQTDVGTGAGLFCIYDADGDYGTGIASFDEDARAAAQRATFDALDHADRAGEIPQLIWISVTPGQEEDVIDGIQSVVGDQVPLVGGSAADNDISGKWAVFDGTSETSNGVVVSVLFPSTAVSIAYQNGYVPTETKGRVTKAQGRQVLEIDGHPAATVYAGWTDLPMPAEGQSNILAASTFAPLGRDAFDLKGVPYYLLAHPSTLHSEGGLDLFANVQEGETITLMDGGADALAARAGRVAAQACVTGGVAPQDVAGALVVFCGGCMLGVQDKMSDVVSGVRNALPDQPFLGVFTFGEQGPMQQHGNRHGNLMVSAIVFSA